MGFLFDGLDAEAYDRQYNDGQLLRRIVGYFTPEARRMFAVGFTMLLDTLSRAAMPIIISRGVDEVQTTQDSGLIITYGLVVAALGALAWLFNFIRRWLTAEAVGNVVLQMREDAFDAVMKRDLSFYDQFPSGKIVSRVTSDTQAFSTVVTLTIDLIGQLLLVAVLIVYLFFVDTSLTGIVLIMVPLIIGVALGFRRVARFTIRHSRRVRAEVSALVQETVAGISVAKTFRQEHAVYADFLKLNRRSFWINLRMGYVFSGIFPILLMIVSFAVAALVYFGGLKVQAGELTAGDWYLFAQGVALLWFPLTSIASFWSQFQLGLASGERVFALIDSEPKVVQRDSRVLPELRGEIEFASVQFSYTDKERVLDNFSLHIRPGETLALVGHTGAGKSSIGKLIARFYEFQAGRIMIDGVDIRLLDLAAYRARLGVVTQTPFLFDGTVRENIRYGKPGAPDSEVERAARQIGNGDWLKSLTNGLDTEVGERGGSLSMGQRQLVALARVMLQDPAIFILDEATASVDPLTETLIQEGLDAIMKDRTSIVIAHRLSTIRHADRIIVLKQGKIIEQGNHDQLLEQGGHYAELYNTYFRHQSLEYIEAQRKANAEAAPESAT
ncbi:MAG: ABC transporter ATP-binding protein [Chloroflexi bacterium CFX4]|nr:ABC transporter ATP-binding protein [Chloroflexi bacterium CFX4]MDL1921002.1 ABC transporter ATP-binding protein [Chloroflexi bacterium CFX3]